MGGRQLQKLLKERESLLKQEEEEDSPHSSASDSDDADDERGTVFNPFSLLNDDDDRVDEEEEESEEIHAQSMIHKQKAKSKKKKKKKLYDEVEDKEEDIDQVFRELDIEMPAKSEDTAAWTGGTASDLLQINCKYLRAEEELKRLFGSDLIHESRTERNISNVDGFSGASRRIRRLAARGLIRQHELRHGILIHPRNTWPPCRPDDLKLNQIGTTPKGRAIMSYIGSPFYESVQAKYAECQASFNPRMLMGLLQAYPYHIDGLLTMSDVYRSTGDGAYSDELIEKALYMLERGWPKTLLNSINHGPGIHIPFEGHNKSFFLVLMRYIQILGKRGLHRSALEISKLMLSLNNNDPCGILFTIDYYALRCKEYDFVHQMSYRYDDGGIAIMPNIVYSVALARYYQEQDATGKGCVDDTSANDLLVKSFMIYPEVLVKLQKKLQEDIKVTLSNDWQHILGMEPFVSVAVDPLADNASLERLADIFTERHHLLWKSSAVQSFMLEAAKKVTSMASASAQVQRENLPFGLAMEDWQSMRHQAFPSNKENAYGHLHVHDFSDTIAALPPEEMQAALEQNPDPMEGLQPHEVEALLADTLQGGDMDSLDDTGALAGFLRSLLPWVNAGQAPSYSDDEEEST